MTKQLKSLVISNLVKNLAQVNGTQVFYGFKSMASEDSTAMRCAAELGELMIEQFETIPPYLYAYSDGGPDRKTDNLSVQKSYIALFLLHNSE